MAKIFYKKKGKYRIALLKVRQKGKFNEVSIKSNSFNTIEQIDPSVIEIDFTKYANGTDLYDYLASAYRCYFDTNNTINNRLKNIPYIKQDTSGNKDWKYGNYSNFVDKTDKKLIYDRALFTLSFEYKPKKITSTVKCITYTGNTNRGREHWASIVLETHNILQEVISYGYETYSTGQVQSNFASYNNRTKKTTLPASGLITTSCDSSLMKNSDNFYNIYYANFYAGSDGSYKWGTRFYQNKIIIEI